VRLNPLAAMMFVATYPERISHLILFGTFARFLGTDDDPFMRSEAELFVSSTVGRSAGETASDGFGAFGGSRA
jgi:hypothetical protein